jgi:hypothetical protein
MFVLPYEGTMHVHALLWVVFGGIYVVEHVKEGVDGVVFEVACHILFSHVCCKVSRCWLRGLESVVGYMWWWGLGS